MIQVRNISSYIKGKKVLDNVSINLYNGKCYGFIGHNGCGKTMLFRCISGLLRVDKGEIFVNGKKIGTDQDFIEECGTIIGETTFINHLSGYDNLLILAQIKQEISEEDIQATLEKVGLRHAMYEKYKNYSLGMKQRLGLALALINNPDLLILDEPLNGLDPQGIAELRETLRHLNKKYGITMVISSHILDELEMIATRYGFIHKGHMIEEITVDELHEKLKKYISLDVENISLATITIEQKLNTVNYKVVNDHTIYLYDYVNDGAKVASTLIKEGVMIEKMNVSNMSLENYYFSLIKGVENNV